MGKMKGDKLWKKGMGKFRKKVWENWAKIEWKSMGNGGQEKINDTNKGKKYGKIMGKSMAKFGKIGGKVWKN